MHERLQNAHIKFERMPAVDGSILSDIELKKMVTPLGRMLLTRGTIGCFLSHRKSWASCISRDRPLLILEDDAAPAADFKTSQLNWLRPIPHGMCCSSVASDVCIRSADTVPISSTL